MSKKKVNLELFGFYLQNYLLSPAAVFAAVIGIESLESNPKQTNCLLVRRGTLSSSLSIFLSFSFSFF